MVTDILNMLSFDDICDNIKTIDAEKIKETFLIWFKKYNLNDKNIRYIHNLKYFDFKKITNKAILGYINTFIGAYSINIEPIRKSIKGDKIYLYRLRVERPTETIIYYRLQDPRHNKFKGFEKFKLNNALLYDNLKNPGSEEYEEEQPEQEEEPKNLLKQDANKTTFTTDLIKFYEDKIILRFTEWKNKYKNKICDMKTFLNNYDERNTEQENEKIIYTKLKKQQQDQDDEDAETTDHEANEAHDHGYIEDFEYY
jgi:DNA polymerase III gamma/tau subunit